VLTRVLGLVDTAAIRDEIAAALEQAGEQQPVLAWI